MTKKKTGQRNFFRFLTLIGVILLGIMIYSFLNSAPNLSQADYHQGSPPVKKCIVCHVQNPGKSPIMPHRPMGSCTFCHRPSE